MTALRYHQATFELLNITPEIDPDAVALLDALETRQGVKLPASVREWYSIKNAPEYLRGNDHPCPVADLGTGDPESFMVVVSENQSVCYWSVKLDNTDNPPVYRSEDDKNWSLYADTFAEFCYIRVWDWATHLPLWLDFYRFPFPLASHERLHQHYDSKPMTYYDHESPVTFRFGNEALHLALCGTPEKTYGMMMAASIADIIGAVNLLFRDCDPPGIHLWNDRVNEQHIVQQIRDWKEANA